MKGQASEQVQADDVETGMGPVFALLETRVRWTFTGWDGLELRADEKEVESDADGAKAKGNESGGG